MVHVISTKFNLQSKCNITDSHYSVASAAHLGIKHTLDVLHQFDCLGWFGVVDERGLFEPKSMLSRYAATVLGWENRRE